jgi:hypothetical protein
LGANPASSAPEIQPFEPAPRELVTILCITKHNAAANAREHFHAMRHFLLHKACKSSKFIGFENFSATQSPILAPEQTLTTRGVQSLRRFGPT